MHLKKVRNSNDLHFWRPAASTATKQLKKCRWLELYPRVVVYYSLAWKESRCLLRRPRVSFDCEHEDKQILIFGGMPQNDTVRTVLSCKCSSFVMKKWTPTTGIYVFRRAHCNWHEFRKIHTHHMKNYKNFHPQFLHITQWSQLSNVFSHSSGCPHFKKSVGIPRQLKWIMEGRSGQARHGPSILRWRFLDDEGLAAMDDAFGDLGLPLLGDLVDFIPRPGMEPIRGRLVVKTESRSFKYTVKCDDQKVRNVDLNKVRWRPVKEMGGIPVVSSWMYVGELAEIAAEPVYEDNTARQIRS